MEGKSGEFAGCTGLSPGSISYLKPVYNKKNEVEDFILVVSNQKFASEFHKSLNELVDSRAT